MAAYGSIQTEVAGLIHGVKYRIGTLIVQNGDDFDFGDPVFVDEGIEDLAYVGDDDDASLVFAGVCVIAQRSSADEQGEYESYDEMNVLEDGMVWVTVPDALTATAYKAAYAIVDQADGDYEKFTTSSTGTYPTGCYFRSNPTDNELALLEVNGLYAGTIVT